jgi:hypothetical protein
MICRNAQTNGGPMIETNVSSTNPILVDWTVGNAWPSVVPAMLVNNLVVAGRLDSPGFVSVEGRTWGDALVQIFPKLKFTEVLEFLSRLQQVTTDHHLRSRESGEWNDLAKSVVEVYRFRYSDEVLQLIEVFGRTPLVFQQWALQKNLSFSDLQILLDLSEKNLQVVLGAVTTYAQNELAARDGVLLMELLGEVLEVGHPVAVDNQKPIEQFLKSLKALRYPLTNETDQQLHQRLSNVRWPAGVRTQFVRKGDVSGIEVKMFITKSSDLEKNLRMLSSNVEQIQFLDADSNQGISK